MIEFTPKGRLSKEKIDTLLNQIGSDEWLANVLKGPFALALGACALALIVWFYCGYLAILQNVPPPKVLLGLLCAWPFIIFYAAIEMRRLFHLRMREQ